MWQVKVSHKSEMAGPFNRGDNIVNKHFTLLYKAAFHLGFHCLPKCLFTGNQNEKG